jgi:hypothetical protein
MAEFQWWLLIVGLIAGGGLVAVVSMDGRRREQDIGELEQRAEASWIADQLTARDRPIDPAMVETVLRSHREYLSLQPPDRLLLDEPDDLGTDAVGPDVEPGDLRAAGLDPPGLARLDLPGHADADGEPDQVRDDGRRGPDEDLPSPAEQHAATRQEAHAGADREQGGDR